MCLCGCGKIGFDPVTSGGDATAMPIDAPSLPATLICNATRIPIDAVPAGTEVAAFQTTKGFTAIWAHGGPVFGIELDSQLRVIMPPHAIVQTQATGVAGLVETSIATLVVATTAGGAELWSLTPDL